MNSDKVVRALSSEPLSTRAWAIGAAGEEKLAAELAKVPELRILNDRRVPGTRGNIDHIVIAPAGMFVVDAKAHKGRIEIRDRGGLFRTDYRLTVGGRDCSSLADGMGWQVEAVLTVLRDHGADPVPAVTPVLCFLEAEWPLFHAPDSFRGVRIESARSLARILASTTVLTVAEADGLAALLSARSLPSLWADAGPAGRQAIATAIFARTDVLGFERMEYELTPDAIELGLDAASPAVYELTSKIGEFGRGERISADTTSPVLLIPVTNVPSYVHRASEIA